MSLHNQNKIDERIETVQEYGIDPDSREIWISGTFGVSEDDGEPGVEHFMANRVIRNLHYLRKQSTRASVTIHLHSCGGHWSEGMAIYDTISLMPYPVTIISYTHARSMSSLILQSAAGQFDTRLLMPNSYFMFHYGTLHTGGNCKTVYSEVEFTKKQDETMLSIYTNAVKKSKKFKDKTDLQIKKIMTELMDKKDDVYLTAKEAVEWGFADGIVESWPENSRWRNSKKLNN